MKKKDAIIKDLKSLNNHDTLDKTDHELIDSVINHLSEEKEERLQLYTALLVYETPPDTLADGEEKTTISYVYTGTLEEVIDAIHDDFDGYDTFEESIKPEIHNHFDTTTKEDYFCDDWSAGEWFSIGKIQPNKLYKKQIGEL